MQQAYSPKYNRPRTVETFRGYFSGAICWCWWNTERRSKGSLLAAVPSMNTPEYLF